MTIEEQRIQDEADYTARHNARADAAWQAHCARAWRAHYDDHMREHMRTHYPQYGW